MALFAIATIWPLKSERTVSALSVVLIFNLAESPMLKRKINMFILAFFF